MLALATFGMASAVTNVTPVAGTANPFAYGLTGEFTAANNAASLKVSYALNTDADAVALQVLKDGEVVAEEPGLGKTKGTHTATIDLTSLLSGAEYYGNYTWQIAVTGDAKATIEEFAKPQFFHPRGVDVDNNFESPNFGNIYVTEGMKTTSNVYWSGTRGCNGLYIFKPDMTGVRNEVTGNYAFMGGLTVDENVATGSVKGGADLARVRVAEDGRIFVTRDNDSGKYILMAASQADLVANDKFVDLLGTGTLDASTYAFNNAGGEFVAGPNLGFDIKGSGKNLKIVALSAQQALWVYSWKGSRIDVYELGNASVLPTPTQIKAIEKAPTTPQSTNVTFDNRGGFWFCQYRTSPNDTNCALAYIDANGEVKFKEGTGGKKRGGGGIRLNADNTQIAIASSQTTFSIYDLAYAADNTPTLTEVYNITHGIGTNVYDIAWDLAGNIYICGNSGEYMKGFALPRSEAFATKAASKYAFVIDAATAIDAIEVENAPVEYYNLQGVKVENPSNGIFIKKQGAKATKVVL